MNKAFFLWICLLLIFLTSCENIETENIFNVDIPNFHWMFENEGRDVWDNYKNGEYGFELYYLASRGGWGGRGNIAIYKNDDGVQIIFYQSLERYKTRQLAENEIKIFESFVTENQIDNLHDWDTHMVMDGIEYQYMHFSDNRQSTFYMNNPGVTEGGDIYAELVNEFFDLTKTGDFEVHYALDKTTENMKILIKNEDHFVETVWKNGDDFRVLIKDVKNSDYRHEYLDWYKFDNGVVGEKIDEPEGLIMQNPWADVPGYEMVWSDGKSSLDRF